MHRGFTKLFNTIVTSTIWQEDDKTRIVWITMLAISDAFGNVFAAIPGLASVSNVSVEAADKAIKNLLAPDPYSRTKDRDGIRIEPIDGGWHILNYVKYRQMLDEEERKEYKARWIANRRAVDKSRQPSTAGRLKSTVSTQAEAEAIRRVGSRTSTKSPRPALTSEELIEKYEKDPTYAHLNIRIEFGKASNWHEVRGRKLTQRAFVAWINRAEKPISSNGAAKVTYKRNYMPPPREVSEAELQQAREIARREKEELRKKLQ